MSETTHSHHRHHHRTHSVKSTSRYRTQRRGMIFVVLLVILSAVLVLTTWLNEPDHGRKKPDQEVIDE